MGITKKIFIWIFLLTAIRVSAQSSLNQYKEARRLFDIFQYNDAIGAFSELTDDPYVGNYASFYYAIASHKEGYHHQSLNMFKQILSRYPNWDQTPEVLYWAALESFEVDNYRQGIQYLVSLEKLTDEFDTRELYLAYLMPLNNLELEGLYQEFPENRELAFILSRKLLDQPFGQRNNTLLNELTEKFEFEVLNLINPGLKNEFKEKYTVALVLPFMFSSLDNPVPVMRNSLVMDLYQGMSLANKDLDSLGIDLDLKIFDTRKSGEVTRKLLDDLRNADLIVGPFYPDPIEVVREFSMKQKINMINPLTENADYIGDNIFSFLFKPSYLTTARKMGEWAVKNLKAPGTLIYYDRNERDSLFAEEYAAVIQKDSFEILDFRSMDDLASKEFLDVYSEQYEEFYPKEEADSIAELGNRFIKTRRLRNEELKEDQFKELLFYDEEDEQKETPLVAYENKFVIPKDSISHIMLASRSNVIVNNILSAVATRGDSIQLYGYGDWLEFKTANYQQMQDLDIQMAYPSFMDKGAYNYEELQQRFIDHYQTVPSEFHFMGYEVIRFLGKILQKNGKYFQNGFAEDKYVPGYLSEGFDYQGANDNQVVPMVGVRDLEIKSINRNEYANKK